MSQSQSQEAKETQEGAEKVRNGPDHPTARLARAVKARDQAAFDQALADGGDPLSLSILINAARQGELGMARELLARGARPEALDRRGFSALYHAFRQGDEPMLRLLTEKAGNKMALIEAGLAGEARRGRRSLFESACAEGDEKAVGLLMEVGGRKPVGQEFFLAAASGSEACAKKVWGALSDFEKGRVKADGAALLIRSAEANNLWAMRLALDELGRSVDDAMSMPSRGYGARRCAQRALDAAAARGAMEAMIELLERGASVRAIPGEDSPLFACVQQADTESSVAGIELLARFGADPNEMSHSGRLPLAEACDGRNDARARALLRAGADPNRYSAMCETPLHRALRAKNFEMVCALLEFGADPGLRQGPTAQEMMSKAFGPRELAEARSFQEAFELKGAAQEASGGASRRRPGL